jgi:hypothetical protein
VKKVVSIAAFGSGDKYLQYLPAFVIAHHNLFPADDGWELRLHLGGDVDEKWQQLARAYAHQGLLVIVDKQPEPLTKAMLWRLEPAFDAAVDFVFCRDLDAAPLPRDRAVCDQFIASGCHVHTVHDNPYHVGMMGGLCGFHARAFREVTGWRSLVDVENTAKETREGWATHGTDQLVLNRCLLTNPAVRLLEHRYNGWSGGPGKHPARAAGHYQCQAWSTPIPDEGPRALWENKVHPWLVQKEVDEADRLATHMGAPGYDHVAALEFWYRHGSSMVSQRVIAAHEDGYATAG